MLTLKEIDNIIEKVILGLDLKGEPLSLYEPIEYMIGMGGKRIRPKLCLATYSLFSENISTKVVYPAIALEIFHGFTLIHDDIMDNADTRRGQPTVYKKWGDNKAILSGDVMQILAYKYLSECEKEVLPAALELFTKTAAQVCEGQQYDMDFEEAPFITMADYLNMIGLKTGVLIACAAKMGALVAGASEAVCNALYEYGYQLGIAFQITDDYLDTFGNQQVFGKKIGGDIENNKKSWLMVECLRLAKDEKRETLNQLISMGLEQKELKIKGMQQLYIELGIKEAAQGAILEYHQKAMDAISNIGLNPDQINLLKEYSEQLIHREK